MRRFKKAASLVLVIAMILFTMAAVSAEEAATSEEKAEVLYELGLFLGVSATEFVPDLESSTNREQAMAMIARALAWELDEDAVSGFDDVSEWAEMYVACAVYRGVTDGVGDNLFGSELGVTERQLQTWFDRALDEELRTEEGRVLSWEANAELDNETALIRGDLVDHTWEALMKTPVGEEKILIEMIVGDDIAMLEIAVQAGLIVPEPVDPEEPVEPVDPEDPADPAYPVDEDEEAEEDEAEEEEEDDEAAEEDNEE